ncbi:unnamed protein product [Prunus armeniaca]
MLRHVVRRWSAATHTFVCSWGEFTPTLEDVANISRLPVCGDHSPFGIALTPEEMDKLAVLQRGAPTSPSTSLRFSNWIQYFGDANRQGPYWLAAFIALWLGRFVLCDFSQDCLHERVFPLALAIARGDTIPLAPMFLGHLYHLLDQECIRNHGRGDPSKFWFLAGVLVGVSQRIGCVFTPLFARYVERCSHPLTYSWG